MEPSSDIICGKDHFISIFQDVGANGNFFGSLFRDEESTAANKLELTDILDRRAHQLFITLQKLAGVFFRGAGVDMPTIERL